MKTEAIGRLGAVTKLLQTQRRDSQWRIQDFVNRGAFPHFSEKPTRSKVRDYHPRRPGDFLKSATSVDKLQRRHRQKKCDASTNQSNTSAVSRRPRVKNNQIRVVCSMVNGRLPTSK